MKKILSIVFCLVFLFSFFQCQSMQDTDSPNEQAQNKEEPKPKTESASRSATAEPKSSKVTEMPSEVIDINQIKIVPMPDPESPLLKITKNKAEKPIALLSLETSNSGLDLIGSILKGEILEHAIVIRNEKGEEIGRSPVNVIEYEIEEVATNKGEKKILLTESGAEIGIKKSTELPPITRKAKVRTFAKNEIIPQYIELTTKPKEGSYVSVNLELLYVKPFAEMNCYSSESEDESCSRNFHTDVQSEIQSSISEKEGILNKAISEMKEDVSLSPEYREQLALRLRNSTNKYRSDIKSNVSKINQEKLQNKAALGSYYYREWKLINSPKYFQVTYADSPKPIKKQKTQTDYTYFAPNETSTEALEESQLASKNIVIEVNPNSKLTKELNGSQTSGQSPQNSQTVSLEQAQRQDIGVGSNCIIYLKSGKFFKGKIVSLEGYSSIQVEVSGNVIDVLKKDIEVIYIPKSTLD